MPYWWGKGWTMMAWPFGKLVVLYRMLAKFTYYEMINVWDTVLHLFTSLLYFFPRIIFFKIRIKQVTKDILSIRFTYYTKDNHQGCSRLSNWFSFWCFGPWMNHFPPLWWFIFKFRFLNVSWCISLVWWRGIFYWYFRFRSCFGHEPSVAYYFSCQMIILT